MTIVADLFKVLDSLDRRVESLSLAHFLMRLDILVIELSSSILSISEIGFCDELLPSSSAFSSSSSFQILSSATRAYSRNLRELVVVRLILNRASISFSINSFCIY